MIRYFDRIENLGVFANYKKPANMVQFERFNLIYGLNGSGKTTLSRFFADLNTGEAAGFEKLKYKISTDEKTFTQGQPYARKIRVFNSEYVDANIGTLEGTLNPIFVIGEENKTLVGIVEKDEQDLATLKLLQSEKTAEQMKLTTKRGKFFTDVAREISTNAAGTSARTYRKNDAEAAFFNLLEPKKMGANELAIASNAMKQQPLPKQEKFGFENVELKTLGEVNIEYFKAIDLLEKKISDLVTESATSIAITRLVDNPEIAQWVEHGFEVHHKSDGSICEYCQQAVPKERKEALASHFNESDRQLKDRITKTQLDLEELRQTMQALSIPNKTNFYEEFQQPYSDAIDKLSKLKLPLLNHLVELTKFLNEKLARRTESYAVDILEYEAKPHRAAFENANEFIQKHNSETDAFDQRLKDNWAKIETHFLSVIVDSVTEVDNEIEVIEVILKCCADGNADDETLGIKALSKRIGNNRLQISNSHKAAEDLSEKLASFLGRDDLKFVSEGEGYRIMRYGRAAKRLSEGEKTAITFLYFVVGLRDQDFDLAEGIVVIDDPISSLDSSSVYQAFSYMKNAIKDAKQVFLLTHNFEFLKLLLNWFQNIRPNSVGRTYWMLHCTSTGSAQREAELKVLDKILLENKNEFTYLMKQLIEFESQGTIEQAYPIPNIARKVLETFLELHSNGRNMYTKLENLDFDKTKKDALYKYTNDLSHPTLSGLDPALVGETKTNVKHLLELIEKIAPAHYKSLTDSIGAVEVQT